MRIGLVSDTHNDRLAAERALTHLRSEGITVLLHAGDVTDSGTLRLFEGFDMWIARGNMDHDPGLGPATQELFGCGRLRAIHRLTLDGASIALAHNGDAVEVRSLIASGALDYVILGHSHRRHDQRLGKTRVINPGALGNARWCRPSFAILDLSRDELSSIEQ
ncbi:MAG: metallophosphatase family protein [Anaerolineae bacterium]|jgi:hypothetical protein|nr:metallophosphatase family protein [Anaerolineae bacterium]